MGLERMGAVIELVDGYVRATAPQGLAGARVELNQPSVGATENLMMAAALARGQTMIAGAAREPEIVDLSLLLQSMGASIEGAGSSYITIEGVPEPACRPPLDHARPHRGRHLRHGGGRHGWPYNRA